MAYPSRLQPFLPWGLVLVKDSFSMDWERVNGSRMVPAHHTYRMLLLLLRQLHLSS